MATNPKLSELKKRALLAKQRMRMGYWQNLTKEKERVLSEIGKSYNSLHLVRDIQHAKIERDFSKNLGSTRTLRDEAMFCKVCKMLDENENVSNPIGKLVEHEIYDYLDEDNKQRYILELSKKFCEMKERYYKERIC